MVQQETVVAALSAAGCALSVASLAAAYMAAMPRRRYDANVGACSTHACVQDLGYGAYRGLAAHVHITLAAAASMKHVWLEKLCCCCCGLLL